MNLINDEWIPVIRQSGVRCLIAPWQIAEQRDPVMEVDAARPDFRGALYQFLLGVLQAQLVFDAEDWDELYESPPTETDLKSMLSKLSPAFDLITPIDQPAFMQDLTLRDGEAKPIEGLLIEAPGGKTVKDNLDFFVKSSTVQHVCPSCAAQALFTLQANAPSGGVGHRVSLRGGGPLTTLIQPMGETTLWQKLVVNLLDQDADLALDNGEPTDKAFPWLAQTQLSDKQGKSVYPSDENVHPLQQYWGMPRRIRLTQSDVLNEPVHCDLCGASTQVPVTGFITRNYGVNYEGDWMHPLTPYRIDPKKHTSLSLKGQPGGITYRHWLGLSYRDASTGNKAAKVVSDFYSRKHALLEGRVQATLWCFGFDMDNMKARNWYDHRLPMFGLASESQDEFLQWAQSLVNAAVESAKLLRDQVKKALFNRPKDVKGDLSYLDVEFLSKTEAAFYQQLRQLIDEAHQGDTVHPQEVFTTWYKTLRSTLTTIFDQQVLNCAVEERDLKRVLEARTGMLKIFEKTKSITAIKPPKDTKQKEKANV